MKGMLSVVGCMVIAVLLILAPVTGSAPMKEGFKVGFVDMQKIHMESAAGKKAQDDLDVLQKKKEPEVDKMDEELRALAEKIGNPDLPIPEESRDKLREEYARKRAERDKYVSDLLDEAEVIRRDLRKLVQDVAKEIAEEQGYAIVLERLGVVIYGDPKYDLTEQLMKRLNSKTEPKKEESK